MVDDLCTYLCHRCPSGVPTMCAESHLQARARYHQPPICDLRRNPETQHNTRQFLTSEYNQLEPDVSSGT